MTKIWLLTKYDWGKTSHVATFTTLKEARIYQINLTNKYQDKEGFGYGLSPIKLYDNDVKDP